ncbi:MAG: glycosyltransferase [Patescibacteria group bacterium]
MRPSRPYHAVTAYHREPGGLRRLDFFVARIAQWEAGRDRTSIRVLDVGCGKGNVSFPLSQLGYRVTGIDTDKASIEEATKLAGELGLATVFLDGPLERVSGQMFDVIIANGVLERQPDPVPFLNELRSLLAPNGLLLLSVPRNKKLGDMLYANGWKVQSAASAGAGFKGFYEMLGRTFIKRGSPTFHALDRFDAWLTPLVPLSMADGLLIDARPFDPSKTRVVQVLPTLAGGGTERLAYELARRLSTLGFEVQTVALFGGGELEPLFREAGLPLLIIPRRGFGWFRAAHELVSVLRRERPQAVQTHLFGADVIGAYAAWRSNVRVIISTEHNVNLDHGPIKRAIKRIVSHLFTAYIAVSPEVKRYMADVERIPAEKVRVIPNGIDMARVIPRPPGPFHDIPKLLIVGRLASQKGQDVLFKALALVKRPWSLDVVGTGEREPELKALAERLEIASRIRWLGFRSDVPQMLSESDIFCFPSRWEGLGLAFLEAAAAGVPVVASDLPVFHEMLDASQAAYAPVGDVPAFAHAFDALLQDPIPYVRRAYEAALIVHGQFSIDGMVASYADLYTELLASAKRP